MSEKFRGRRKFTASLVHGNGPGLKKFSAPKNAPGSRPSSVVALAGRPTEDIEGNIIAKMIGISVAIIIALGTTFSFCGRKSKESEQALSNYITSSFPYDQITATTSELDRTIEKYSPDKRKALSLSRKIAVDLLPKKDMSLADDNKNLKSDLGNSNEAKTNLGTFFELPGSGSEKIYMNEEMILLPLTRTGSNNINCVDGNDNIGSCKIYLAINYSFNGQNINIKNIDLLTLQGAIGQIINIGVSIDKVQIIDHLRPLLNSYWRITNPEKSPEDLEKDVDDIEEKNAEDLDRHKQHEFSSKLEHGMVRIDTKKADWNGGDSWCSGWMAAPDVIGTAKHCVISGSTERMLTGVNRIITNGSQIARLERIYKPKSESDYIIVLSKDLDLAAITLRTPVFNPSDCLKIRTNPVSEKGRYFAAHFAGYDFPQLWKVDRGEMKKDSFKDPYGLGTISYKFNFSTQGGNSGGPIVDYYGDVISLFGLGSQESYGPKITASVFNDLVKQGKERLSKL